MHITNVDGGLGVGSAFVSLCPLFEGAGEATRGKVCFDLWRMPMYQLKRVGAVSGIMLRRGGEEFS